YQGEFDFKEHRYKNKTSINVDWFDRRLTTTVSFLLDNRYLDMPVAANGVRGFEFRRLYPIVRDRGERLTFSITFVLGNTFHFTGGASYDLDGDIQSGYGNTKAIPSKTNFDGGFMRMMLVW